MTVLLPFFDCAWADAEHVCPYGARDVELFADGNKVLGTWGFLYVWNRHFMSAKRELALAVRLHCIHAFYQFRKDVSRICFFPAHLLFLSLLAARSVSRARLR